MSTISNIRKSKKFNFLIQNSLIIIGSLITALGFNLFLGPSKIASGGMVGISILINQLFHIEPAITQWIGNIPLFFLGLFFLGKKFTLNSALGTIILPLFIFLTKNIPSVTSNALLASIYGGVLAGIGLGLVFKGNGSTGGTSILAAILNKFAGISIGNSQAIIDAAVIIASGFILNPEKALYAILSLFITGKVIDIVQLGFKSSMVAFVISDKTEDIRQSVLEELNRGITKLSGCGGYTDEEKTVLMVVMEHTEVNKFKKLVNEKDEHAFVIISNTHEVLGQGFNLSKISK
ncbi:YitT family protein [Clostridium felsineum]|uniref:YitT family protein n=1 Tax=Clostridium felsineum TaxID=36839 RepID=UPI00098C81B0|nr:YitT family protein [Clostridium felsineum]URZ17402.1 hypothetical protein CLFE_034550 [Clostridium felsineum DSM 794]